MKKNLLMLLLAVLCGVASSYADMVRINVDTASNVVVTTGNGANTLSLMDGMNSFDLTSSDNPITIEPANGATIESVIVNGTQELNPSGGPGSTTYRTGITGPMMIQITTTGGSAEPVNLDTYVMANMMNAVSITCNGQKSVVTENGFVSYPEGTEFIVAAEPGYELLSVSYQGEYWNELAVKNADDTWCATPDHTNGSLIITAREAGIHFTVDINVASNVAIVANLNQDMTESKALSLTGNGPFEGTAPEGVYNLQFYPAAGGSISSITRIESDGTETKLVYSDWVGWASVVAEGDQFIIDAEGPEVELTFNVARGGDLSNYCFTIDGVKLDVTPENPTANARVGETLTMAGGKGYSITGLYTDGVIKELSNNLGLITGAVLKGGAISVYGTVKTGMTVTVDNAAAVTVTGGAGNGSVISLNNGENIITTVQNPLKIAATTGYRIVSVIDDGEVLKPNADGSYNAELLEDGSIIITTAELPKPLLLTFSVTGDASKLIFTKDGVNIPFSQTLEVASGTELTVAAVEGWLIKELTATGGNKVELDEETGVYSMIVRKAGSFLINVEEWTAAEGNAMVRFISDTERVSGLLYNEDGERDGVLKFGLNEVKIGTIVKVLLYGDIYFNEVKVNGEPATIAEDGKSATFTIEGETTIDVTTYVSCSISGYKTSNPDNHSFTGYIYINEIGQLTASIPVGETFTVLPTPERGYKFDGFDLIYPSEIKDQIGDEIKDSYTVTIPEGVTDIVLSGKFVLAGDEQLYTVRGGNTLIGSLDDITSANITNDVYVYINIAEPGEVPVPVYEYNAFEGETVHLMATAISDHFEIITYCLYYNNLKPISPEYVVNGEDADANGVITVSAIIKDTSGVEDVVVGGQLSYDGATQTLTAPEDVKIYTASGNLVLTAKAGEVSLQELPAGLYIATTGTSTLKIAK